MAREILSLRYIASLVVASVLLVAACAPAAAPAPTAAPAKPAAPAAAPAPTTAPAAPAAQPTAAAAAKGAVELRAGCSSQEETLECRALNKFIELVNQKSGGRIAARSYGVSLGIEQQLTQSVISGSVDIGMCSGGNLARFTDAWLLWDLPFLFKNTENMLKSFDTPVGKKAIEQFEKDVKVKTLWVKSYGAGRDIQTTKKQVKTVPDIKGLKIRTISSPIDLATFKAWGANPTPIDWAQTFPSLQQGVLDGENIPIDVFMGNKHGEIVKYYMYIQYQQLFQPFFLARPKFDALSPDLQKVVTDAAEEAKQWNYKDAASAIDNLFKEADKQGTVVYRPTPQEYEQWASIREGVWKEVAAELKGKIDLDAANQLYKSQ